MAKKVTKKETYLSIIEKYAVEGSDKDFLLHEVELLDKRAEHKSDKPTKKQTENEGIKGNLLSCIVEDEQYTATDLRNAVDPTGEMSVQRVSALLTQMVKAGTIARAVIKRRTYFALPGHEFTEPKTADAE